MASTTVITFITPDNQRTVYDRIAPVQGESAMTIDRIAAYLTSMANGSNKKTSLTLAVGGLPVINL